MDQLRLLGECVSKSMLTVVGLLELRLVGEVGHCEGF